MGIIRLVLASPTRFYRDGLAEAIARYSELHIVATASSGEEAGELAILHEANALLLDTAIVNGQDAVKRLHGRAPHIKVIVIAIVESAEDVLKWAEAGAAGYVDSSCTLNEMVDTVKCTIRGELRCSPRIAAEMLQRLSSLAAKAESVVESAARVGLTQREQEILRLIALGLSNKRIAVQLGITTATTKNHVHNILSKLNVHRRSEAAARARDVSTNTYRSHT